MLVPRFDAYIKLEQLADEVKTRNNIKVGAKIPRFDVTMTAGYYKPLKDITNNKGQIVLYLTETRGIIGGDEKRRADRFLMAKNSLNFSSVYILECGDFKNCYVGFGNPNRNMFFGKNDTPNPFYENRDDGYVFLIKKDWSVIEVFVVANGGNLIQGIAKGFTDNVYNDVIFNIRALATIFYEYK